jgi:hypothetical protein
MLLHILQLKLGETKENAQDTILRTNNINKEGVITEVQLGWLVQPIVKVHTNKQTHCCIGWVFLNVVPLHDKC